MQMSFLRSHPKASPAHTAPPPVKSLLVSRQYFPPQTGGISHLMYGIARALGPARVACLTAVPGSRFPGGSGPRVYRRPAAFSGGKLRQALRLGATLAEIMLRERFRMLQLATTAEGYLALRLYARVGMPFVLYAHGNEILAALQGAWEIPRRALRTADRVLANSRFTSTLVERVGTDPDRVEVVYPGCDTELFMPREPSPALRERILGPRRDGPVLLTIGNLVARKGHDLVIQALSRMVAQIPDVTYVIVGEGPHGRRLEELANAIGIRNHVVFAGRREEAELPDLFALADIFVMPSRADFAGCDVEGFGLVFLEAGACGKPVVGGRSGGIPEAIVDGATGFLVDPEDPEDLARVLTQLLQDRDLMQRLGEQGRHRVLREFTWTRVGGQVAEILDTVMACAKLTNKA
jgi:phosphatidyl-myo-inositol dimannoside synthase